jgi:hypothetical protein
MFRALQGLADQSAFVILRSIAYAKPPIAIVTKPGARQSRFTHSSASEASQISSRVSIASPFALLHGAAVMAFRLSLIAQEQRLAIGLAGHAVEAFTQEKIAVLGASDFDVPVAG